MLPLHNKRMMLASALPLVVAIVVFPALVATGCVQIGIAFLQPDEQLLMRGLSSVAVQNGPGSVVYNPLTTRATRREGVQLTEQEYIVVKDALTAVEKSVAGPQLYFLGPHEQCGEPSPKVVVEKNAYVRLLDARTGELRQVRGPATVVPEPHETFDEDGGPRPATQLSETEYVVVTDRLSGAQRVEEGPQLLFPSAYDELGAPASKISLNKHEFVKLLDSRTGEVRVVAGPAVLAPAPTESLVGGAKRAAYELRQHQYVRLVDRGGGH